MNELEQLLAALGVQNFGEAMTTVARLEGFLNDARARTGTTSTSATLDALRDQGGILGRLEASTGKNGADALAVVEGWRLAAERTSAIEAELSAIRKSQDDRDAAQLMDEATRAGRLPPASRENAETFYKEFGLKSLRTFLQTLPESGVRPRLETTSDAPRQPRQPSQSGAKAEDGELTPEELAVAKAMRKTPAQMREAKKLWDETQGVIDDAHLFALNDNLLRSRNAPSAGR